MHSSWEWMHTKIRKAIEVRRAYRALEKEEIDDETLDELTSAIQLAPSCFNNQPWNYVFIRDPEMLEKMKDAMSEGNEWTFRASMIAAVFSKKKDDCVIKEREYHLFDTGVATAFLILRATELGLVAHPIAGYSEKKVKEILDIPEEYTVITLVIFGRHSEEPDKLLDGNQLSIENKRPERKEIDDFVYTDKFL